MPPLPGPDCETCDIGSFQQTQFLGLTVRGVTSTLGFNTQPSEMTITLVEDDCNTPKRYYNECCELVATTDPDPGFFGEKRYERPNGSQYSSVSPEDPSHNLIRDAINIVGGPAYFRLDGANESFEWSGIISDWVKQEEAQSQPTYQVKLVDPRIILQGVQLIIGDYAGRVDQTVNDVTLNGTGCPTVNLFNVYGYSEIFGNACPPVVQCAAGHYDFAADHTANPAATCPGAVIDGEVFGTYMGGFAGSYWNESGMPLRTIIDSFNILANSSILFQNEFSPYGRVMYYSYVIPTSLSNKASGLLAMDQFPTGCLQDKFAYHVDLSDVPIYNDFYYRVAGTSISLLDLLQKLSEDFNFDFYVDLLPVKDNTPGFPCIRKFIKVHAILRNSSRNLGQIATFLENNQCTASRTTGVELRPENNNKYILGAEKVSVYQALQNANPDANFTVPANDANTIASLDSINNQILAVTSASQLVDNTIVDYLGLDDLGNMIIPYPTGAYLPLGKINSQLRYIKIYSGENDPMGYIFVRYEEMLITDFDEWMNYISGQATQLWLNALVANGNILRDELQFVKIVQGGVRILRDLRDPNFKKGFHDFMGAGSVISKAIEQDFYTIFEWVTSYGRDYLGKKYAVRVPFTCCALDTQTNRIRISEQPTNEGGWTEISPVLNLKNFGNLSYGRTYDTLNLFRDELGRIRPFVQFSNASILKLTDLNREDYTYHIEFSGGSTGTGPPDPSNPQWIYTDTASGNVYLKDYNIFSGSYEWVHVTRYNGFHTGFGNPPATIESPNGEVVHKLMYYDFNTNNSWITTTKSNDPNGDQTGHDWIPMTFLVFMKAEVQENYVFHDASLCYAPRVVVEIPQRVTTKLPESGHLANTFFGPAVLAGASHNVELFERYQPATISAAAIPMKSNTLRYGPWYNPSNAANTDVIVDESLAPWNFNGFAGMNIAGAITVNDGRSDMAFNEIGSITFLGYPKIPLGAELNITLDVFDFVETRTVGVSNVVGVDFNNNPLVLPYLTIDYRSPWSGLNGPNVTGLSVSVGEDGKITTQYDMRSFTPRTHGLNKWLVNRLREISNLQRGVISDLRNIAKVRGRQYGYEI